MEQETKYLVKRRDTVHKQCTQCHGIGKTPAGNRCIYCSNGVSEHFVETEIELTEALYNLGLLRQKTEQKKEKEL